MSKPKYHAKTAQDPKRYDKPESKSVLPERGARDEHLMQCHTGTRWNGGRRVMRKGFGGG
jgi:hypothetical protein